MEETPATIIENFREKITSTENFLSGFEQLDIKVEHCFGEGLYRRKATAPKDSVIVSMVHLHDDFAFIMTGEVTVVSEGGSQRIKAPAAFLTMAGTKRMIIAHEESVWYTVHALPMGMGEHSEIKEVESYIACGTLDDYEQLKLEANL